VSVDWKIITKVAIYKYHTNEFVYKNEGVGAMSEQSDQIGKIFTHTEKFLAKNLLFFLNTIVMINYFQNLALI
jgi:hypothetical protein